MKVAVIGGGWAGLAAAEALAGQADVTLFEAGKTLGGRARAVAADSNNFAFLDNGQHLLVGAYQQCLALLARAGVASRRAAEEMIANGRVEVNGELILEQGRRVDASRDVIHVDDVASTLQLDRTAAAQRLGLTFRSMRYRLKKLGLD